MAVLPLPSKSKVLQALVFLQQHSNHSFCGSRMAILAALVMSVRAAVAAMAMIVYSQSQ